MPGDDQSVPGVDLPRVTLWLEANIEDVSGPFDIDLIAGGWSNLTYLVRDRVGRLMVLRRPPIGHLLESAHDMGREHRIIEALQSTPVAVPKTLALCVDPEVNGAPFYLMDFEPGVVPRDEDEVERSIPCELRAPIADSLIDALADLHALDPNAVGLGDLARQDEYIERQLRRWQRQWESTRSRELPEIDRVHDLLARSIPAQSKSAIVHGDFRLDNTIFRPDGRVRAILDWELCTLGDPLADLGLLLVNWVEPGEDPSFMLSGTPTMAPGFPTREHLLSRYARRTGADVSRIDYYVAFGNWKLACIADGIRHRFEAGAMGRQEASLERLERQTSLLAQAALATCARL